MPAKNKNAVTEDDEHSPKKQLFAYGNVNDSIETPKPLMRDICKRFGVKNFFDPCPLNQNAKRMYINGEDSESEGEEVEQKDEVDGLSIAWENPTFINPPFSAIPLWINKTIAEMKKGISVVALLPARTNTRWWNELVMPNVVMLEIFHRAIKFHGYRKGFPTPLCICYFCPGKTNPSVSFGWLGSCRTTIIDFLKVPYSVEHDAQLTLQNVDVPTNHVEAKPVDYERNVFALQNSKKNSVLPPPIENNTTKTTEKIMTFIEQDFGPYLEEKIIERLKKEYILVPK
jgi:site-specific DNA-methyltransferase (adenine-specific)